jgi:hypothetical protein
LVHRCAGQKEEEMGCNVSRVLRLLVMVTTALTVAGCSGSREHVERVQGGSPPVITHSFAVRELNRGDVWRIYIAAEDPDGDMREAVGTLEQVGYGRYAPSIIRIRAEYRGLMKGYVVVQNRTGSLWLASGNRLNLSIYITDAAGHTSETMQFPVLFTIGAKKEPVPELFAKGEPDRLGVMWFDLVDPLRDMHRGLRRR